MYWLEIEGAWAVIIGIAFISAAVALLLLCIYLVSTNPIINTCGTALIMIAAFLYAMYPVYYFMFSSKYKNLGNRKTT
jgi:hypothetical protein